MQAARPPFALKLMPSFADFAFLTPMVFLFARMGGLKTLFGDCDTGWHIRTGEWISQNHMVPARDIFSFSKAGDPWYAWEWLSDVVLAWLNGHGGLQLVAMFAILLLCVTFALLFRFVRRKANPIVAVSVTMIACAASSIHWLARPHLFTMLFLVLFYVALERVREGRTHVGRIPYLAILPVVTILWTNLHGGFFVGVVLIAAYGIGEVLQNVFAPTGGGWGAARRYFVTAAACLVVSLANPYTYQLHVHIAQYLRDPFNSEHIVEFLSPSFHHPTALFFETMLVLSAATACWNIAKGRWIEPVCLLLFAHAALLAVRNIAIFAIVAAPPVAAAVQEWIELLPSTKAAAWLRGAMSRFVRLGVDTAETEAVPRFHLISAVAVLLVAAVIWAPHPPNKFRAEFDPNRYPVAALAALGTGPEARVFTDDEWGDYLIWSGYPNRKVFVDGRSDFYGDDFEEKYISVVNVKPGWENTLNQFGINTILLSPTAPLTGALRESSRWKAIYEDKIAVVFRPPAGRDQTASAVVLDGGMGRDREVTKTEASDRAITVALAGGGMFAEGELKPKPKLRSERQ